MNKIFVLLSVFSLIQFSSCSDAAFVAPSGGKPSPKKQANFSSNNVGTAPNNRPNAHFGSGIYPNHQSYADQGTTNPADICEVPQGNSHNYLRLGGEDYPGNPVDHNGGDYNDFWVYLSGKVVAEHKDVLRIGVKEKTTLNFDYHRIIEESDCYHAFKIVLRKCPNRQSTPIKTYDIPIKLTLKKNQDIEVPVADVFIDIILITSPNPASGYCDVLPEKEFSMFDPDLYPLKL